MLSGFEPNNSNARGALSIRDFQRFTVLRASALSRVSADKRALDAATDRVAGSDARMAAVFFAACRQCTDFLGPQTRTSSGRPRFEPLTSAATRAWTHSHST